MVEAVPIRDFTQKDLEALRDLAVRAGQLALQLRSSLHPQLKGDGTLVTEGDVRAEELLREGLSELYPGVAIVGEESGTSGGVGDLAFFLDPVDGTLAYARGSPTWAVCLGVLMAGCPYAGAVVVPALGQTWWGMVGFGAYCGGRQVRRKSTSLGPNALISITTGALRRFGPPPTHLGHVRCHGSIAWEMMLCADNQVDAALLARWKPWDVVGPAAILLAAGGVILAADGAPVPSWTGDYRDELVAGGSNLSELVPAVIPGWAAPTQAE